MSSFCSWIIPFYSSIKVAFLLWMLAARDQAALVLFHRLVHPFIKPYETVIDAVMESAGDFGSLITFVSTLSFARAVNLISQTRRQLFPSPSPQEPRVPVKTESHRAKERASSTQRVPPPTLQAHTTGRSRKPSGGNGGDAMLAVPRSKSAHTTLSKSRSSERLQPDKQRQEQLSRLVSMPAPPTGFSVPTGDVPSRPAANLQQNYAFIPSISPQRGSAPASASPAAQKLNAAEVLRRHNLFSSSEGPTESPGSSTVIIHDSHSVTGNDTLRGILSPHMPGFLAKTPAIPGAGPSRLRDQAFAAANEEVATMGQADDDEDDGSEAQLDDTFMHVVHRKPLSASGAHATNGSSKRRRKTTLLTPARLSAMEGIDYTGQEGLDEVLSPPLTQYVMDTESDASDAKDQNRRARAASGKLKKPKMSRSTQDNGKNLSQKPVSRAKGERERGESTSPSKRGVKALSMSRGASSASLEGWGTNGAADLLAIPTSLDAIERDDGMNQARSKNTRTSASSSDLNGFARESDLAPRKRALRSSKSTAAFR